MSTTAADGGLYAAKAWFTRRLHRIVDLAVRHRVSPDTFTTVGILFAVAAGVALALGWWHVAVVGIVGRLAGANLDGAVARARRVARPFGAVLNEVGDRVSDLAIMTGLVALAWRTTTPAVALLMALAALAATLPTFAALAVAAAGGTRRNGGPFGKTERCLVAALACPASAVPDRPAAVLSGAALLVLGGSLVTATLRVLAARRELAA